MMEKPRKKSRSRTFQAKKKKKAKTLRRVMNLDCMVRGEGRKTGGSVHSIVLTGQLQEFICKTVFVSYRRV